MVKQIRNPAFYIFKKEILEIRRGRLLPLLILMPLLQVIIFGFVATTDVKHVAMMVCDEDQSSSSRALADRFAHSEYFSIKVRTATPLDINKAFAANKVRICIRIPHGFMKSVKKGKAVKVQVLIDGSDSNTATLAMNYAASIIRQYSSDVFAERIHVMRNLTGPLPSVALEERIWYNPELKSSYMMVPGLVGLILAIVTLVITSVSLVREKESGNIEQLIVTPVRPWHIIAGKILPYAVIGVVDILIIALASMIIFGINFRGDFLLFLFFSFFMIISNLGLGIFISTVSRTQQQAMLSAVFIIFPSILLSGFIFAIKNMPGPMQWLTYLIPMRYYMVIVRGMFLKGLGWVELWPQVLALAGFGFALFGLAIWRFRKKLA
jgi:ABC-2 type transport system permease protein